MRFSPERLIGNTFDDSSTIYSGAPETWLCQAQMAFLQQLGLTLIAVTPVTCNLDGLRAGTPRDCAPTPGCEAKGKKLRSGLQSTFLQESKQMDRQQTKPEPAPLAKCSFLTF